MAKKKFSVALTVLCCVLAFVIGFIAAFYLYSYWKERSPLTYASPPCGRFQ